MIMTFLLLLFFVGVIVFRLLDKAMERGLRKNQESNLSEREKTKRISAVMLSIKIIKFGVTVSVITIPLFWLVRSAENWGLAHQQKIIFYGFFTIFYAALGCYVIYHVVGKILGKKKFGIFASVFFGIIMLFFVYWIIRITVR